jgi:hypothetical protein
MVISPRILKKGGTAKLANKNKTQKSLLKYIVVPCPRFKKI